LNATDDCTPVDELIYSYVLDLDNDGSIDAAGGSNDASRTLEVGTHKITFTVEDQCGNQSVCMFEIEVLDKKKPTPYCLSEITTVIMPSSGMIDIWASDFDLGSFDNCPGDVLISFSSNVNNTQAIFTCDDLGINELQIWVTDASGNQDFCTTQINIQDNGGCNGSKIIGGDVASIDNEMIDEVMVTLQNMSTYETAQYMTPFSGHYQFLNMPENTNYQIKAEKNSNHGNGVSTLDLVLIQRHILGLQSLDSPYKVIAADINNSQSITSVDLLELRKLILGIWSEYENNKSWRFIDAQQEFPSISNPFPYDEKINILDFLDGAAGNDFVGVKIGDVNNSASVSLDSEIEATVRNGKSLTLSIDDVEFTTDELIKVPVTSENFEEMVGFQFTLETNGLEFENVEAGALEITNVNVGNFAKENALTFSWNSINDVTVDSDEVLFTIVMRANTNDKLNNALAISSAITTAEAYTSSME